MRRLYAAFIVLAMAVLVTDMAAVAQTGQYVISYTTLSSAQAATDTTAVLTSASARSGSTFGAPAAGQCLFVDRELERITAVASTTMTVTRDRTNGAATHASGATVFTAPCSAFKTADPNYASGGLTCSGQPLPWINQANGNIWVCMGGTNKWSVSNVTNITYNSVYAGY